MKKHALVLIFVVAILLVLTACGGNATSETGVVPTNGNVQTDEPTEIFYLDIYLFHESVEMGIYFTIHPAWLNLYGIEETEFEHEYGITRTVTVYHLATREEFGSDSGILFSISRFPDVLADGPIGIVLAQDGGYTYAIGYPQDSEHAYDSDSAAAVQFRMMMGYLEPWDNNFITNNFLLSGVNPFATALLEYFADSAPMPDADSTMAFMVNVDGAPGVVAIRHPQPFFPEARLFVFTGIELIYKDIGSVAGFPSSIGITQDGRPVKVSGDAGDLSYTLFGGATDLETHNDVIIYTHTIYAELVDFQNMTHNHYQFRGGFEEGIAGERTPISEEEFNELRARYGLDNFRIWFEIEDETEQILALTFSE